MQPFVALSYLNGKLFNPRFALSCVRKVKFLVLLCSTKLNPSGLKKTFSSFLKPRNLQMLSIVRKKLKGLELRLLYLVVRYSARKKG